MAATAPPDERYATLDIVRGVAVIGILIMNILVLALPAGAVFEPLSIGYRTPLDTAVWAVEFVLFDGKMRGLFSLLFGASLIVVADRVRVRGGSVWRVQGPRLAWLFVIGSTHHLLLWSGDILVLYAVVGTVALLFVGESPPALKIGCALALVVSGLLFLSIGLGSLSAVSSAARAGDAAADLALHQAPWLDQVVARANQFVGDQVTQLLLFGPETLGLMLLGMVLVRSGLLLGQVSRSRALRLAGWSGVPALIGLTAMAAGLWHAGFPQPLTTASIFAFDEPFQLLLTVAWAALLCSWASGARGELARRLEAAGRCAFTNYVGTSLVMVTAIDGLDLFGRLSRSETLAFVVFGAALMLAWPLPWLTRFAYGPLEWLWRSLARGRLQPLHPPALDPRRC